MKRFLIIQTAFLGDLVLTTPLMRQLKSRYSNEKVEIHVVTAPGVSAILSGLEGVFTYELRKRELSFFDSIRDIKKKLGTDPEPFDEVLCVHRSFRSLYLAWQIKCRGRRLAFSNRWNRGLLKILGFSGVAYPPYSEATHYRDKILALLGDGPQGTGDAPQKTQKSELPWLSISTNEATEFEQKMAKFPLNKPYIVMSAFSTWGTKEWPLERFLQLGDELNRHLQWPIVFIGSPENEKLHQAQKLLSGCPYYIDMLGKTNLGDLKIIISRGKFLVSNDSAPIHIAAAFDRPTVAIFGPTVKKWGFFPLSTQGEVVENLNLSCRPCSLHGPPSCPLGHFRCMNEINIADVNRAVHSVLRDLL